MDSLARVCSGRHTVGGNLSNHAIVSQGNSPGSLTRNGDLTTATIYLASAQSIPAALLPSAMGLLVSTVTWLFGL